MAVYTSQRLGAVHPSTPTGFERESDQHPLDAPGIGARHVLGQPVFAQQLARHFHHDVVGLQQAALQVVAKAAQALQAAGAAGQDLDIVLLADFARRAQGRLALADFRLLAEAYLCLLYTSPSPRD